MFLSILNKEGIVYTNTYFYVLYNETQNFDELPESEKDLIRQYSKVEGYCVSCGRIRKTGIRNKIIRTIKQGLGDVAYSPEEVYCGFLIYLTDTRKSRAEFKPDYDPDHKDTGQGYEIDKYIFRLVEMYLKNINGNKMKYLYLRTPGSDDEEDNSSIDIDRLDTSQTTMCSNFNSLDEYKALEDGLSYKDTLLALKFFEHYYNIPNIILYIQELYRKSLHKSIGYYLKKVEKKYDTLPKLNYTDLQMGVNRTNLGKKITGTPHNLKYAFKKSVTDFTAICKAANLDLTGDDVPVNLIHENYLYSLRNGNFLTLKDYIKNRVPDCIGSYIDGSKVLEPVFRSKNMYDSTAKMIASSRVDISYKDIIDLLTCNLTSYKDRIDCIKRESVAIKSEKSILQRKYKDNEKTIKRITKAIDEKYDDSTKKVLTDDLIEISKIRLRNLLGIQEKIKNKLKGLTEESDEDMFDTIRLEVSALHETLRSLCERIYNVLQQQLVEDIIKQDEKGDSTEKISTISNVIKSIDLNPKFEKFSDNVWYINRIEDASAHAPILVTRNGMMIFPVSRKVSTLYGTYLNFNLIDNVDLNEEFNNFMVKYRTYFTNNAGVLKEYVKWSHKHGQPQYV